MISGLSRSADALKNPLIFENMWKINSLRGYEISVN